MRIVEMGYATIRKASCDYSTISRLYFAYGEQLRMFAFEVFIVKLQFSHFVVDIASRDEALSAYYFALLVVHTI